MASEFPEDKLVTAQQDYRIKFGDYVPRHALHGKNPEAAIRKAIRTDTIIPEDLPGNTIRDDQ